MDFISLFTKKVSDKKGLLSMMGHNTSRPKALSISGRTSQFVSRIRRASSQSYSSSLKGCSLDSLAGSLPSTANSSRVPSIDQAETQTILINQQFQDKLAPIPEGLSPYELSLVHTTWQLVISDSSNICLNFFLQMKKAPLQSKGRWSKSGQSTPISHSPPLAPVQYTGAKFLMAGSKHSDMLYYALRLSCCIDRLIFRMRTEGASPVHNTRRSSPEFLLDETGELQEFLGLDDLKNGELQRMVKTFIDSLRLVMVHSQTSKNIWTEELQKAWTKLLYILIDVLKTSY